MMRLLMPIFAGIMVLASQALAQPATQPTTAPADQLDRKSLDAMLRRLSDSLSALNLSGDKKALADLAMNDARSQVKDLRDRFHTHQIDQNEFQSEGEQILFDTRDRLAQILTQDEQQRLGDEINTRYVQSKLSQSLRTFEPNGTGVMALAFSPDDKTLACGNVNGTVWLWDVATGKEIQHFTASENWVLSVRLSADGKRLLTGEGNGFTHIWDLATDKPLVELDDGAPMHFALFFNHEKNIATCDNMYQVRTWDAATGQPLQIMEGHEQAIYGLAVTPDDKRIVSSSMDHSIRIWDAATGKQLQLIHAGGEVNALALSPDGSEIYSAQKNRSLRVWDINTGQQLRSFKDPLQLGVNYKCMQISPDGKYVLTDTYSKQLRILDSATGKQLALLPEQKEWIYAVTFSHDEHLAACAGGGEDTGDHWIEAKDDKVRLWDITPLIGDNAPTIAPTTHPATQSVQ